MDEPDVRVVGYVRYKAMLTATQMYELQQRLFSLAHSRGLEISALFLENAPLSRSVFDAALARLGDRGERYLIIPSADHLAQIEGVSTYMLIGNLQERGIEVLCVS